MKVSLNGNEMEFVEGGYKYVFMKPYHRFTEETITKENGDRVHMELYDNGVQIRTLITREEVATLINRDVAIDKVKHKIFILEKENSIKEKSDGSIEVI